ncbi:hypothetical protein [Stygiolobus caldivivus]|uniref:Uncharacterized protein n=1 Tax=Stygiolobus caldivivus TaxID=2824673 RepID=A0A8D5U4D7_9CREN|nr:hypothetical protein [Stygiolobus caldivivus]BCU68888.1 hypothetical protein KN1_01850 [Stygiolobus caldivivus]
MRIKRKINYFKIFDDELKRHLIKIEKYLFYCKIREVLLSFLFLFLISLFIFSSLAISSSSYYLTYQVNLSINSFVTESYNGTVTLYLQNYSYNNVVFDVIGTGNLYSFAQQTNFNITKVILMEAYNGTYTKPVGLGDGFPMLNGTELKSLSSGKFSGNNNGTTYNVSKETIVIGGVKYQTYKLYGSKTEVGESGSVSIWVNQSNGIIVKIIEKASSVLGAITITVTLTSASLPKYLLQAENNGQINTASTATTETTSIQSTTVTSTPNVSQPVTHQNLTTNNSPSDTPALLIIILAVVVIVILFIVIRKKGLF